MPDNIIVLSESAILYNPIFAALFVISFLSSVIFIFAAVVIAVLSNFKPFCDSFVTIDVFDVVGKIAALSLVTCLISAFCVSLFPYKDSGYKEYTVIAQTEEQIKYIYENYDITGSDGDIYYIQERIE